MITIAIKTDNAAFKDGEGVEVARILSKLAVNISRYGVERQNLRDLNGNRVGQVEVDDD